MAALLLLLLAAAGITGSQGLALTKEENQAVLQAAQADPDAAFYSWAARHERPYLKALQPLLSTHAAVLRAQMAALDQGQLRNPTHPVHLIRTAAQSQRAGMLNQVDMVQLQEHLQAYSDRQRAWQENLQYALTYNQRASGHWLGLNGLADLSYDEYKRLLGTRNLQGSDGDGQQNSARLPGFMYGDVDLASLPRAVDWRNSSAVTHVKNQGMCGSCWAFATTGAIEGVNALYSKKLVSLSEQELVDCDRDVDMGCSGGMMDNAYEWIVQHQGLHTESDWPYTAEEAPEGCTMQEHEGGRMVTIDGYQPVPVGDESALLKAAAHQPVAVAVEADSRAFQLYMGGVMSDPGCGSQLNHGVLVVGYGGLDSSGHIPSHSSDPAHGPYWIVKNSWGDAWGAGGYINIQMGYKDNETGLQGLCGITLAASYPVKTSPNPKPKPKPTPTPGPAPKPDQRVQCDGSYSCPPQSTCCCVDDQVKSSSSSWRAAIALLEPTTPHSGAVLGDQCGSWGCCPMASAVCCEDHLHCCPPELPVCDVEGGRCLPKTNGAGFSIAWLRNIPATKDTAQQQPARSMRQLSRRGLPA